MSMEAVAKFIIEHLAVGSKEFFLILFSSLPVTELRGGIPVGILLFDMPPLKTYVLCCVGNSLPIIPLLLLFGKLELFVSRFSFMRNVVAWYTEKVRERMKDVKVATFLGLVLFVAIPLPVTGAWTGSVGAFLLGVKWQRAFLSIFCGVLIAGLVVTFLTVGGYSCYAFLKN